MNGIYEILFGNYFQMSGLGVIKELFRHLLDGLITSVFLFTRKLVGRSELR
jgi:hypothetical protein